MQQVKTGWARAAEWYAAGLFLVYALLLFTHRSAPSLTDLGNWTYQGFLLREHLLGHPDPAHLLKRYPVPNSTATVGLGLLMLVLPWSLAAKAWLCLQLAFNFAAMRHLLRTVQAGWVSWVVMPQAVFLNINFWYGFLNFQLGIACVLLAASLLLRRVQGRRAGFWSLALVLLLAFFTHMIAFAVCALLVLLYAAQTRRWRTLWLLTPTIALTLWYLIGRFLFAANADGQAGMESTVRTYSAEFWAFKANSYLKSFGFVDPYSAVPASFGHTAFFALLVVNVLLAALVLRLAWAAIRSDRTGLRAGSPQRFLWLAILIVLPLFLLAPGAALGVSDPGARLLQAALALTLALLPSNLHVESSHIRSSRIQANLAAVAALCAFALTLSAATLFRTCAFPQPPFPPVGIPKRLLAFDSVPNHDQDYFYACLRQGILDKQVFPTGLFLNASPNASEGPPASLPDGPIALR